MKVIHDIPPLYDLSSRVLILGSLPSPKSRDAGFFYMHPQNRFWRILAAVFGQEEPKTVEQRKRFALEHKIAMWDVIAECDITGASDASIKNAVPNEFSVITSKADIRAVLTTGKTAGDLYKRFTGNESITLPSPSPANCAMSFDTLVGKYKVILDYIK